MSPIAILNTAYFNVPGIQPGERAAADGSNVGYLDDLGDLEVFNPGGTPPPGSSWDVNTLIIASSNTYDHVQVNGGVVVTGSNNPVMTQCRVVPPAGEIFCSAHNGTGLLTMEDCDIVGNMGGVNPQVNGIASDGGLIARRCSVTRSGDGIHLVSNGALIEQCWVGPLRFTDAEQHCDGIQQFQGSVDGSFTVQHCYIARTSFNDAGVVPMNAALTAGPATDTGPLITPTLINNFFGSAIYNLRLNFRVRNAVVEDNDFDGPVTSKVGDVSTEAGITFASWSNNRDYQGNLISQP